MLEALSESTTAHSAQTHAAEKRISHLQTSLNASEENVKALKVRPSWCRFHFAAVTVLFSGGNSPQNATSPYHLQGKHHFCTILRLR